MQIDIDPQKLERTLSELESLFASKDSKDFGAIERFSRSRRLSADEIRNAISEYPGDLNGFNKSSLDMIKVKDPAFDRWSVNIRFRRTNGEDSDLNLSLYVQNYSSESTLYDIDILDIHVL